METKFTKGPWKLCYHLESEENDKSCPCGYRGGIWGGDEVAVVCEMGSTEIKEELSLPRYDRKQELANAQLISAAPELLEALQKVYRLAKQIGLAEDLDFEEFDYIGAAINKALAD